MPILKTFRTPFERRGFVIYPPFAIDINSMNFKYKVYSSLRSCVPPCI